MEHLALGFAELIQSETAWAVVVGMLAIKIMDLWDRRLIYHIEREHHKARRSHRPRRNRKPRKS